MGFKTRPSQPRGLTIEPALEQAAAIYLRQKVAHVAAAGVRIVGRIGSCRNLTDGPMCVPCILLMGPSWQRDFTVTHDRLRLIDTLATELGVPRGYATAIAAGIYSGSPPADYVWGYWLGAKLLEEFGDTAALQVVS